MSFSHDDVWRDAVMGDIRIGSTEDMLQNLYERTGVDRRPSALDKQTGGDHYKKLAIQPIEYCHRNKLGPCESFVVKYVTRYKDKNGKEDLLKAIHCIELLIAMEYPEGRTGEN